MAAIASQFYYSRIMLKVPIWIVTEHIQPTDAEHSPEAEPGTALAFSSSSKLFRFMSANVGGEWKMQMADDRDGLVILIADLHRLNISALSLDPEKDAVGEPIALADLVNLAHSLR